MLIASHDLSLITRLQHRILTLDQGSLVQDAWQGAEPAARRPRP
jgi:cell division transport system ATP-binding protein